MRALTVRRWPCHGLRHRHAVVSLAVVVTVLVVAPVSGAAGSSQAAASDSTPDPVTTASWRLAPSKMISVRYCLPSLPFVMKPRVLEVWISVNNTRDQLPPISLAWPARTKCAEVLHPTGGMKQPFRVLIWTRDRTGARSERRVVRHASSK